MSSELLRDQAAELALGSVGLGRERFLKANRAERDRLAALCDGGRVIGNKRESIMAIVADINERVAAPT